MPAADDDGMTTAIVWGVGLILPPVTLIIPAIYHGWGPLKRAWAAHARRREVARLIAARRTEEARRAEAYRRSLPPPPPPPPPPPTREEQRAAAHARYEAAVEALDAATLGEAERRVATEQAKQTLFRELDRLMKP
jgi:hypothetical protein